MKRLAMSLVAAPVLILLALLAPAGVAAAGPVAPSTACTAVGTVVTCDLWAKTGSVTLPGTPLAETPTPIWGFAASATDAAGVPGPVLIVNSGDSVTVTLHNDLPVTTAILFEGQPVPPDLTGVAAGLSNGLTPYSFKAGAPGSYLYEAGLLPGTQYQAAMGLYGALIVRPTGGLLQANDNINTAFTDEAVVVLGEIDPKLNGLAAPSSIIAPSTFDLRGFAPRYFLINGKPYPQTDVITTGSGNQLLIHYLNAGIQHHSMGVLGLTQTVVNDDGSALAFPRHMTAESLAPGQATDNLITIPTTSALSTTYVVYNAALALNNTTGSGANAGIGGMLTTIVAGGLGTTGDTAGPVTSGLTIDNTTGAIAASVSDVATGGSNVTNAEYFIDTLVAPGGGLALSGAFGSPTVAVSGGVTLGLLASGDHTLYARGFDGTNWGPVTSAVFTLDTVGPATTGVVLTPSAVNTTTPTTLTATADDRATGGANIAAAQFTVDGGTPIAMALNTTSAPVSSLSATIPAGLSLGSHTISITSQDALLNWGLATTVTLVVNNSGPVTSGLSVAPDPNNGTQGINSTNPSVRVRGTFDTTVGTVNTGEIFIDTQGADGTGVPMPPTDGIFNSNHELAYVDVPLFTIAQLGGGDHPIYVHGKDSMGNWGVASFVILHINKPGPTTSAVTLTPSISSTVPVAVGASATTNLISTRNVTGGEYFIDAVGLTGTGTPMTVAVAAKTATLNGSITGAAVAGLAVGNHTIYVRAHDSANNWGPTASAVLVIERDAPTFTSITLTPASIIEGTVSIGLAVNGAADVGSGVAGGEFWIGTTPIAEGTGTAFNGTTTTVPTASLVPGDYQVNVRIRDNAGNWSTSQNTNLHVEAGAPPPDTTAPTFTSLTLTPNLIVYTTPSVGLTVNGASDVGTGVVGGEFWIDTVSIPAGTGTAFVGTTATVPTGSLLPGTYNVRVRINDAATPTANWSTVQSAVLTVSPPVAIFSDSFEYAVLPGPWSSRSTTSATRLNTSTLAAQLGSRGLRAQGDNTNYVQYDFGSVTNPVAGVFDARFSFRPNAKTTGGQDIFTASSNTAYGANRAFRVRYRRSGGLSQVQIQVGTTNSAAAAWRTISGGTAYHKIEVVWQAVGGGGPNPGRLELLVDGVHWQTLTTTSTRTVGSFRLGAVSVGSGSATYEYFDNFAAKRTATPYLP